MAVLKAVEHNQPEELNMLRVDQNEYRDVIWPRIPQTELVNIDVATAWSWVERDSYKAIGRMLSDLGGSELTLKKTIVSKETRAFPQIRVIYGVLMVVVDADGNEGTLKFMNVVGEVDGYYRVIAYDS